MGYYAQGGGTVTFNKRLTAREKMMVTEAISDGFDYDIGYDKSRDLDDMSLWPKYEKYYEDEIIECLSKLNKTGLVMDGDIEYIGEDSALWRFHYVPMHGFIIQSGHVEYDD